MSSALSACSSLALVAHSWGKTHQRQWITRIQWQFTDLLHLDHCLNGRIFGLNRSCALDGNRFGYGANLKNRCQADLVADSNNDLRILPFLKAPGFCSDRVHAGRQSQNAECATCIRRSLPHIAGCYVRGCYPGVGNTGPGCIDHRPGDRRLRTDLCAGNSGQ